MTELNQEQETYCGFIAIVGRPNVGKSTLLNNIVNYHVAITSDKAGTTRNIIEGIYNDLESQIVFVDTPGINKPIDRLGKVLNKQSQSQQKEVDCILMVVDAKGGLGRGDKEIIKSLNEDIPTILVLNKIDGLKKDEIMQRIVMYKDLFNFSEIVPVSARSGENVKILIEVVKNYLTDDIKYFKDDAITSSSIRFMIAEYVREKLFNHLEQEIPHAITCVTTSFEEKEKIVNVNVDIIVDRESLKKIIIGHNGEMLKNVGMESRKDIEKLVDKKVYLELYVKCIPNWRDKEFVLKDLGFYEF